MRKLTLILTLALLIIALSAGLALAEPTELTVAGEDILANPNAVPGVSYANGVLTLNNATIAYSEHAIIADGGLHIVLLGDSSITVSDQHGLYCGIWSKSGHLTISGPGSLNINCGYNGIDVDDGDITVTDSDLTITAGDTGINAYNNSISISGGKLNIMAASGLIADSNIDIKDCVMSIITYDIDAGIDGYNGVYTSMGDITITNSDLTITAADNGVYTNVGDITITDSELKIKADLDGDGDGDGVCSYWGKLSVSNSQLYITAGVDGINADGDIAISDSQLYITVGDDGIYAYNNLAISDSQLYITAGDDGIYAYGNISISDSEVESAGGEQGCGIEARGIIDIINSSLSAQGNIAAIFSWYIDGTGIIRDNAAVGQGGRLAEVYDEDGALLGYTFSAMGKRINAERVYYENSWGEVVFYYVFPGATGRTEMVPGQDISDFAFLILSGVGKHFPFVDVGLDHWAYNDIFDAFKKGLINGKTETLYLPDGPLTYAEAIKLAACIHQLNSMGAVSFEASQPWYDAYVRYAELNEIILPGEFAGQMDKPIIRYDFAHVFGKALPVSAFAPINDINSIPDVPSSNRHADEILMMYRAGILAGSDASGSFNGNSNIKRSEVAAIVIRMIDPDKRIKK